MTGAFRAARYLGMRGLHERRDRMREADGRTVNFDFSDEQKQFQEQVRRALADTCPMSEVRHHLEQGPLYSRPAWHALAKLGVLGASIPESYGGSGPLYLELCAAAEEIGRSLAPVPVLSSIYLGAELLMLGGSPEQKQKWLPRLASGESIVTVAVTEPEWERTQPLETAFADGRLHGLKQPVPDGGCADLAIVLADSSGLAEAVLVDLNGPGVERRPLHSVDQTKPHGQLRFDGAPAERLGCPGTGWSQLASALDRAAILLAFEQIGAADRALEMARDFSLERHAFGRAIGSYQAIKHKLANVYIQNQIARTHAYYGAWALSMSAPDLARAAAASRVAASEALTFAARENIQTHGGMGFTWETDCHLFYRRARHTALTLRALPYWKDRLALHLESRDAA